MRQESLGDTHLKKLGIAYIKAKYFICSDTDFEKKDWQPNQIKSFILKEGNSKYEPNFSTQLKLF